MVTVWYYIYLKKKKKKKVVIKYFGLFSSTPIFRCRYRKSNLHYPPKLSHLDLFILLIPTLFSIPSNLKLGKSGTWRKNKGIKKIKYINNLQNAGIYIQWSQTPDLPNCTLGSVAKNWHLNPACPDSRAQPGAAPSQKTPPISEYLFYW